MKTALAFVLALAASPVEAKPLQCVLWPYSPSCQIEVPLPTPAPERVPEPSVAPSIAQPVPPVVQYVPAVKKAAAPKRVKSTWVKPEKKKVALPSWCGRIPAGTTMDRIDSVAPIFIGRTLTDYERGQARACLASKR